MKLTRSDSQEMARCIASTRVLACWGWSARSLVILASLPGLVITIAVGLLISARAAAWIGIPVFLLSNVFWLWRGRSSRLNWVVAGCAEKLVVRLFTRRGWKRADSEEPDVLMLDASEIASLSARTAEVFLDGSTPKYAQWLVIEPLRTITEEALSHINLLLDSDYPGKQLYVTNERGLLTIKWRWCRPGLQVFLEQVARECASITIGPEERSELDLNGIWAGFSRNVRHDLTAQERQQLVHAMRLGFSLECEWLMSRYKCMALQESAAYLAEIAREETGTEPPGGCALCR
jgi:hypothetical protein